MNIMKSTDIIKIAEKRRKLEVKVADKLGNLLYEKFAGIYKAFAHKLYTDVFLKAYEKHQNQFVPFLKSQTSYDMWRHTSHPLTIRGLDEICNDRCERVTYKLLLYMLSDLIRLTGEWLEKSHEAKLDFMSATFEEKEKLKGLPTFQKQLKCPKCGSLKLEPAEEGPVKSNFVCQDCYNWFAVDTPMPSHRSRTSPSVRMLTSPVAQQYWNVVKDIVRGIERWTLTPDSVIGAIDKTFGLPPGGDVSGTTTDSMSILKTIGDFDNNQGLWALQLIALATLVHSGHHTIVECAYPLTRHKYIDYKIGFYSSLTPKGENILANDFESILKPYDDKLPHVLVWEDDKALGWKGNDRSLVTGKWRKFGVSFNIAECNTLKNNFFKVLNAYSMCAAGPITSTKKAFNVLYSADKKIATQFLKTLMESNDELEKILGGATYAWANEKNLIVP